MRESVFIMPRVPNPSVSVVVTAIADGADLRACLERVSAQTRAVGAELLLIVNAAEEAIPGDSRDALGKLCDRILFEPEPGKSNALNHAVAEARGEVIAFTDDDALPQPGWLAAITAPLLAADRDPALVGCGGPVTPLFPEGETPGWLHHLVCEHPTFFIGPRHELGPEPLDYSFERVVETAVPLGANCAWRREVFDAHRYDPRLGPNRATGLRGGEDMLIGLQVLKAGFRVRYCPDARVVHPVHPARMTADAARRGYYFQGVETVRMRRILGSYGEARTESELRRAIWVLRRRWIKKSLRREVDSRRKIEFLLASRRGELDELRRPFGQPRPPR